ncbi:hypothetical protein Ddc_05423 [Ditylenchus destructor]|nr:hypothetical protein Ddc_05423 [Ditylenchus destructor]
MANPSNVIIPTCLLSLSGNKWELRPDYCVAAGLIAILLGNKLNETNAMNLLKSKAVALQLQQQMRSPIQNGNPEHGLHSIMANDETN